MKRKREAEMRSEGDGIYSSILYRRQDSEKEEGN